jgi:esterase/lipase
MSTLETLMIVFVAVTAVAIVIQMIVLIAVYFAIRKSSARMEALAQLAQQVQLRLVPTVEMAQNLLQEYRPKLDLVVNNLAETSTLIRKDVERLDGSVAAASERIHALSVRIDALVAHTLDRVEEATELVGQSVVSPVRQAAAVLQGVTTGVAAFFNRQSNK